VADVRRTGRRPDDDWLAGLLASWGGIRSPAAFGGGIGKAYLSLLRDAGLHGRLIGSSGGGVSVQVSQVVIAGTPALTLL
jgi:hypothetical protein